MVIVAGHITVDPRERGSYLAGCIGVVQAARSADGCLDFAISADPVHLGRVNIFERWESRAAVERFRGDGPSGEQESAIREAVVIEYDVVQSRDLS
ncbi:antibiotic biosynthesis monooxygenase [Mycobacterium sp. MBM]|nr:antibiotic biosynthesis monooxygenase [Mycobacterium sp. MBM]